MLLHFKIGQLYPKLSNKNRTHAKNLKVGFSALHFHLTRFFFLLRDYLNLINYLFIQKNSITKKYVDLHAEHAPTLIKLAKERISYYPRPIIRPLWYVSPDDAATYKISDQFMVGNDILVAPVLKEGQREREVYLPSGVWIDQHGTKYNGSAWFNVLVPLEELPYFKRQIKI